MAPRMYCAEPRARVPSPVSRPNFVARMISCRLAQRLAEQLLALAGTPAVDIGGVEEGDAGVERGIDHRPRALEVEATPEVVAAKPHL